MKKNFFYTVSVTCILMLIFIMGCGISKDKAVFPLASTNTEIYSSIEPQGDYVVVTISGSNITIQNQTNPAQSIGPVNFSLPTDTNVMQLFSGFHNIYQTDVIDSSGRYIIFALMSGVMVAYQKVAATTGPVGNAGYALLQKPITINDFKPANADSARRFNFIEFVPPTSTIADGFATFGHTWITDKGDGTGAISGAKYDIQLASLNQYKVDANGIPFGVYNPYGSNGVPATFSWTGINSMIDPITGTMKQYHSGQNYWEVTTMTPGAVMVASRAEHGGSFSIPQASSPDFNAAYAGTYFTFAFKLDASQGTNSDFYKLTLNTSTEGTGSGTISQIGKNCADTMTLTPFSKMSATSAPGGIDILNALKTVSGGSSNAYLGYGSFVVTSKAGNIVLMNFDPSGNYFFFMSFDTNGSKLKSSYGFGIKDPNYNISAVPSTVLCSSVPTVPTNNTPPVLNSPIDDTPDVYINTYFNNPNCQPATTDNPLGLHKGIDIAAPKGTAVRASVSGIVTMIQYRDDSTKGLIDIGILTNVGGGYLVGYNLEPALSISVVEGQSVTTGDIIGYLGDNGIALGYKNSRGYGMVDFRTIDPTNNHTCLTPLASPQFKALMEKWFSRNYMTTAEHPGPCTCHYTAP